MAAIVLRAGSAMKLRVFFNCLLLAWAVFAVILLVSGSAWLERPLPLGLPFGNLLAASIPCALALLAWRSGRARTWQRRWASGALVAALAWLPVSIALAGNLALDFSGQRGVVWLGFSAVVLAAVLAGLVWASLDWLLLRYRRKRR